MKILVLGGTQFIGWSIVDALTPHHDVYVLNRGNRPLWNDRIIQLTADRTNPIQIAEAVQEKFDAVVDVSGTLPIHIENVLPVLHDVARYVFISSAAVYDRMRVAPPFREDRPAGGDAIWGDYGRARGMIRDESTPQEKIWRVTNSDSHS